MHKTLLAAVTLLASCMTAPVQRHDGPPRALFVAKMRPDIPPPALGGADAGEADTPDFLLYDDGSVLFTKGRSGLLRAQLNDDELKALLEVAEGAFDSVVGEEDRRVAFDLGEGPVIRMTALAPDGCKRVYIHGTPGAPGTPGLPPPLVRFLGVLRLFQHANAEPYMPQKILVYLDALPPDVSSRPAPWPRGWGLPKMATGTQVGTHVVSFNPEKVGGWERLTQIVRRGVGAPIEKDGRSYKVAAWRAVLPDEARWRAGRQGGALPGCAG